MAKRETRKTVDPETLPYRPCVGIMLINREGLIFVGNRIQAIDAGPLTWQMPQGGIDAGEDPRTAAFRELREETGVHKSKAEIVGEIEEWLTYDLPPHLVGHALKGKYRGQKQRWFAMRFLGEDEDIDIAADAHQEFSEWAWVAIDELADLIVPFKRGIYERIVAGFTPLTKTKF
ncbi:MAG: RNA pyrophosphohydrolase [Parvibaculum sp.]|uniref:RNA pyrophosphohydrolase n=1 Tax=Parvibaculum sp. TaxID=2024848 RepID=UPI0025D1EB86|nr:RNA pyrophosphohydrolase [Parvibaculum sp.]MCE9648434.1 RNA pyrophosphohydrolase [Parvibaculum sp.]